MTSISDLVDNWASTLTSDESKVYTEFQTESSSSDLATVARQYAEFVRTAVTLAVRFKDVFLTTVAILSGIVQLVRQNSSGSEEETLAGYAVLATNFSAGKWIEGSQEIRYRARKFTSRSAANHLRSRLGGRDLDSTDLTAAQIANLVHFVSAYSDAADGFKAARGMGNLILSTLKDPIGDEEVTGFLQTLKNTTATKAVVKKNLQRRKEVLLARLFMSVSAKVGLDITTYSGPKDFSSEALD